MFFPQLNYVHFLAYVRFFFKQILELAYGNSIHYLTQSFEWSIARLNGTQYIVKSLYHRLQYTDVPDFLHDSLEGILLIIVHYDSKYYHIE